MRRTTRPTATNPARFGLRPKTWMWALLSFLLFSTCGRSDVPSIVLKPRFGKCNLSKLKVAPYRGGSLQYSDLRDDVYGSPELRTLNVSHHKDVSKIFLLMLFPWLKRSLLFSGWKVLSILSNDNEAIYLLSPRTSNTKVRSLWHIHSKAISLWICWGDFF